MFELFINNEQIDGFNSNNLVLNKQLFDLTALDIRGIIISNNVILPRTGRNNRIFNILDSDKYSQIFNMKLYWKNSLIIEGDILIKSVSETQIKLQLREDAKQFFDSLKVAMSDLDLQAYDFNFTTANYNTLKNPALLQPWTWPGIDYRNRALGSPGNFFTTSSGVTDLRISRPAFRAWELLTEIIEDKGYIADLSELDPLPDLVISSNAKQFLFTDYQYLFTSASAVADTPITLAAGNERASVNFYSLTTGNTKIKNNYAKSYYGLKGTISITSPVELTIKETVADTSSVNTIVYIINNGEINIVTPQFDIDSEISFEFSQNLTITSLRLTGLINEIDYYLAVGVTWPNGDLTVNGWNRTNSVSANIPLLQDYLITTSYNLPAMTQIQFLQELSKMFYLDFEVANQTVKVSFNNSITKIGAKTLDKTQSMPEDSQLDIFNQSNLFQYTNDEILPSIYGQKRILVDNQSLPKDEKQIIVLTTGASLESLVTDYGAVLFKCANLPIYTQTFEDASSGSLEIGSRYQIVNYQTGDDFTNVGGTNVTGNIFIATGTTPTVWANNSILRTGNLSEDDRAEISDRFLLYTTDINPTMQTVIGSQAYFSTIQFSATPDDPNLTWNDLYDKYYSFLFDNILSNSNFTIKKQLNYLEYVDLLNKKVIYDKKTGKYLLILNISKFNPNLFADIEVISF